MSYTKQNWKTKDVITADKLNHMEDGIEDANVSGLPDVTASDNGKVLGVTNGAWGKMSVPTQEAELPRESGGLYNGSELPERLNVYLC